jgi:choline dehydrogenase-like flavoprotein
MAEQNDAGQSPTCSIEEFSNTTFDYIICGGGTAGLAIAARLTENPEVTVGVVEAGKYRIGDPLVDMPAGLFQLLENPEYDWCMYTAPQEGNHGKVHHIPRGKLLGGSSGINYMMYVRGSTQDHNDWAELVEDEGWSAEIMQHYMRKHQTLEPIDPSIKDTTTMPFVREFHGTSGPVHTGFNDTIIPIENDIIKACDEVTTTPNKPVDPWSGDHIGFYNTLGSICRTGPNKGKRSYAARGYYEANRARPNLKVLCSTLVNKVNLDGNKATGVSISHEGKEYNVSAKREVIVCGGTIKSPQILELSGIGDPAVLEAAGVECKIANPAVGANVQDHQITLATYEMKPGTITLDTLHQVPEAMQDALKQYTESKSGPLASISSMQGFFPAKKVMSEEELEQVIKSIRDVKPTSAFHEKQLAQVIAHLQSDHSANIQLVLIPATADISGIEHQSHVFPPRAADKPAGVTFALCLQYPVARGYVHIESSGISPHPTPRQKLILSRSSQTPGHSTQLRRPRSRRHSPQRRIPLDRQCHPVAAHQVLNYRPLIPRSLSGPAESRRRQESSARRHTRRVPHLRLGSDGRRSRLTVASEGRRRTASSRCVGIPQQREWQYCQ